MATVGANPPDDNHLPVIGWDASNNAPAAPQISSTSVSSTGVRYGALNISGSITATNPSVSATAAGVPAQATYIGGNKSGTLTGVSLDGSGYLNVNVQAGGANASVLVDDAAFTVATSSLTVVGGVYNDSAAAATSGHADAARLSQNRGLHVNLRNNAGTEIGTASTPVQVSLANTGANATKLLVTPDSVALPANQSVNVAQVAGATTSTAASGIQLVGMADGTGNALTSNSATYTAKKALDANLLGTLGTAFSTAGKVDVKGADGDVFVRQTTGSNLHTVIDAGTAVIGHVIIDSGSTTVVTGTTTVAGGKTNNNAAPGATNVGALPGVANAAVQTWTEGNLVAESMDLSGNQRMTLGTLLAGENLATNRLNNEPIYSYNNMTTQTTATVKSGAGTLHGVIFNKPLANGVVTIYDNTAGSGTTIGTITFPATLLSDVQDSLYDVSFGTGLTLVTSGATQDITIAYR